MNKGQGTLHTRGLVIQKKKSEHIWKHLVTIQNFRFWTKNRLLLVLIPGTQSNSRLSIAEWPLTRTWKNLNCSTQVWMKIKEEVLKNSRINKQLSGGNRLRIISMWVSLARGWFKDKLVKQGRVLMIFKIIMKNTIKLIVRMSLLSKQRGNINKVKSIRNIWILILLHSKFL